MIVLATEERALAELEKDLSREPALAAVAQLFPWPPPSTSAGPAPAHRRPRPWVLVVASLLAALGVAGAVVAGVWAPPVVVVAGAVVAICGSSALAVELFGTDGLRRRGSEPAAAPAVARKAM